MSRDYKQECKFLEGCLESMGIQRDKDILKIESLEKENAALRAANESVAVCSDHILDIKGIGCLVCENAALREAIKCVWVSWHEWRDDPSENTLYFLEREINAAGELIPPTTDKGYDPGMLDRFEREAE